MRILPLFLAAAIVLLADSAAGVKWTTPAPWNAQAARPMRAATYSVPAATGDKESGECGVFFFGPGQGGGVQANIDRWQAQFSTKTGAPKTAKSTINGFEVTTIEVAGTYELSAGPMSPEKTSKPNYRLLGAIVAAPQGAVFFKFTGPAKTVTANEAAFKTLLQSLKKE